MAASGPSRNFLEAEILVEDPSMVVWWGTRTECISALTRQVREGSLSEVLAEVLVED